MVDFLVVVNVILAFLIIAGVFLHRGTDGFMGDTAPVNAANGPRFDSFDKVIGTVIILFFIVTFSINYLTVYKEKGTVFNEEISRKDNIQKNIKHIDKKGVGENTDAPLAQ